MPALERAQMAADEAMATVSDEHARARAQILIDAHQVTRTISPAIWGYLIDHGPMPPGDFAGLLAAAIHTVAGRRDPEIVYAVMGQLVASPQGIQFTSDGMVAACELHTFTD